MFWSDHAHEERRILSRTVLLARQQQVARAAGPLMIAWLGSVASYAAVFALMACACTVVAPAAPGVLGGVREGTLAKEAV